MKSGRFLIVTGLIAASVLLSTPISAAPKTDAVAAIVQSTANTPSDVIKNFYGQLTNVMKAGDKLGYSGRYKKLEPAIKASFNLPLMTRYSVGPVWSTASAEEQQQLVIAFSDFSVATYASRFTKYNGEQFDVLGEKPTTGGVMVETTLQPAKGDKISLNYLMKRDENGAYRIVDIFLNGSISELATRRSEFGSIVDHDGVAALVNTLSAKSKQMGPS